MTEQVAEARAEPADRRYDEGAGNRIGGDHPLGVVEVEPEPFEVE